jgi:hypothetical protein
MYYRVNDQVVENYDAGSHKNKNKNNNDGFPIWLIILIIIIFLLLIGGCVYYCMNHAK